MKNVVCDLCSSNKYSTKYVINIEEKNFRYYKFAKNIPQRTEMIGQQNIVECNNCQHMYVNPRYTTKQLELVYSSESIIGGNWKNFWYLFDKKQPNIFTSGEKRVSHDPKLYDWKFDIISSYISNELNQKTKLLDIGCGDGKFVFDAIKRGYDAVGIDLSPDRIAKGTSLYGFQNNEIRCMNVDEFLENEKFDIIVLWDLIEHVESPTNLINKLHHISHDKTRIFILTMSTNSITYKLFKSHWNYINPTQHLHYFSHKTMRYLSATNGYAIEGIELDDSRNKNLIHLLYRIIIGQINNIIFKIYYNRSVLRYLFKIFQGDLSDETILHRLENVYPGKYLGRYHDNFVYVLKKSKK